MLFLNTQYKFADKGVTYCIASICAGWMAIFTRNLYRNILLHSFRFFKQSKGLQIHICRGFGYWVFALLSMLLFGISCFGQTTDTVSAAPESSHIKKMKEYLSLKLSVSGKMDAFVVSTDDTKFDFRPNDKIATKLSFNYRFVSFGISATPKFITGNGDDELKGKSRFINYSLNLIFNHWVQGLSYSKTRGYYLENTRDFSAGWREGIDPHIKFPDLVYKVYQGQTAYKFNKKFSFNAVSAQTERQIRSAGTFMPGLNYRYYILDDRTPLHANNQTQKTNNLELLLSASYYYTYVLKQRWYISAGLAPGAGITFSQLYSRTQPATIRTSSSNAIYKLDTDLGLGYNGERLFAGVQVQGSAITFGTKDPTVVSQNEKSFYQVFVGYRFAAPKFFKKMLDKAEEKQKKILQKI